jgi:hypothetical protein
MKKKTKFTYRLQFTKGGCFVVKKDICLFVDGLLKEDVIMLNLYPDLKQEEMDDTKREFIFVIDRSGKLYLLLTGLVFSSPDPKGHVSYCHHLASVVRL